MKKAIIFLLLAVAAVSAQKQRVAVLPSVGDLDPQRLILLTDKVREIATKNLPIENFNILKQDVITRLIGEEELYRSCKEGVCIGDLAKKTDANYGARCDVIRLDNSLVLKFEIYSVNEESIFETFIDDDVKDFRGMFASLEARLPDAFKKMADVQNKALADAKDKAREQQQQEAKAKAQAVEEYKPTPKTEPAKTVPPPAVAVAKPKPEPVKPTPVTTFTDKRDGKVYKKVTIGKQTWMAENLNYEAGDSKCYGNKSSNCEQYGRLYNWNDAMSACPVGYHLPSDAEWKTLTDYVGGEKTAGKKLKATSDWNGKKGNGTDDYGFSALPSGGSLGGGEFNFAGNNGYWWSAIEFNANYAYLWGMYYNREGVNKGYLHKPFLLSVRCVAD